MLFNRNEKSGKRPERDEDEGLEYDKRNPWNRREKKSELPQYIVLALLCLILAYALSKSVH